ncbi:hypothetical protein PV05_02868 [Exophiala xenobiotica]|uniref:Uncharacterized protein n=1 Tax=Exophiala xenobiotica TaxID=348802 RepID=A0A0D2EUB0_9EURO|nr:uncharacterized protein PV05_02868 [Exophiala xenobiotica]KIW58340.1 hypothetical protein PV05_02868 [Exophiala xenobiotica]
MPKKYTKTLGALCDELGMTLQTASQFQKDTLKYLKSKTPHVPTLEDEEIEPFAWQFLDSGAGAQYFSSNAGLRFRWDTDEHRLRIHRYTNTIMTTQRWYAIENLHQKIGRENMAQCPGCLQHPPGERSSPPTAPGNADDAIDLDYPSNLSDSESIHHIVSQQSTPEPTSPVEVDSKRISTGAKRPRLSQDYLALSGVKKRKTHQDAPNASPISVPKLQGPKLSTWTPEIRAATARLARSFPQFNPTKVEGIVDAQPPPQAQKEASQHKVITLNYIKPTMRYRGKVWQFDSIAQKAKILEMILLQEEKDVESYPVLAFSKGARKSLDADNDNDDNDEGDGSAMKDYFRFYTHFMNERFPGNEKMLLQNGVKPSA